MEKCHLIYITDSYQWGDLYMAGNIKKELNNLWLNCQICLIDWYNYEMYNCNNVLFYMELVFIIQNLKIIIWFYLFTSESYTDEEFKKYNKIICYSKVFYEKIKTNLKLNDDDIILHYKY